VSDSGVVYVSRPGGVGTSSLWWTGQRRLEVVSVAPLDSDEVYVGDASVFVAAYQLWNSSFHGQKRLIFIRRCWRSVFRVTRLAKQNSEAVNNQVLK